MITRKLIVVDRRLPVRRKKGFSLPLHKEAPDFGITFRNILTRNSLGWFSLTVGTYALLGITTLFARNGSLVLCNPLSFQATLQRPKNSKVKAPAEKWSERSSNAASLYFIKSLSSISVSRYFFLLFLFPENGSREAIQRYHLGY